MQSRIVVVLAALVLPIVGPFGCGDLFEAASDRAFDWTVAKDTTVGPAPERISVVLQHPDTSLIVGRTIPRLFPARFQVQAMVFPFEGAPVELSGLWDTWGNFQAEGGSYSLRGTVGDGTAHMTLSDGVRTWGADGSVVQPRDLLTSHELCVCMPMGRRAVCVKCGDYATCCLPNPE
jgi:hypothetical protein